MTDIIQTMPWQCGDKDCGVPGGWHRANWWADSETGEYTCDNFGDGDHDTCTSDDIPAYAESQAAEKEYAQWVAQYASDPLGEFVVRHTTRTVERWQFRWAPTIAGPVLQALRRNKRAPIAPHTAPAHVRQWLQLDADARKLLDLTREELVSLGYPPHRWCAFTLTHDTPRADAPVARDIRRAARRWLARVNTTQGA